MDQQIRPLLVVLIGTFFFLGGGDFCPALAADPKTDEARELPGIVSAVRVHSGGQNVKKRLCFAVSGIANGSQNEPFFEHF